MKFGVVGFDGRLGKEVVTLFEENSHSLVCKKSLNTVEMLEKPDVLIDCSLPATFDETVSKAEELNLPLIMAVTGLNDNQLEALKKLSEKVPVVQSYNFSIGIQVLLKLTAEANKILGDWDVEITETHHRFKKDKPSGTAIMIQKVFDKEINTTALRLGNVAGDHTVHFGGLGEVVSISHRALSRRTFAEGILKSAEFIIKSQPGLYSFTDVLFGKK